MKTSKLQVGSSLVAMCWAGVMQWLSPSALADLPIPTTNSAPAPPPWMPGSTAEGPPPRGRRTGGKSAGIRAAPDGRTTPYQRRQRQKGETGDPSPQSTPPPPSGVGGRATPPPRRREAERRSQTRRMESKGASHQPPIPRANPPRREAPGGRASRGRPKLAHHSPTPRRAPTRTTHVGPIHPALLHL